MIAFFKRSDRIVIAIEEDDNGLSLTTRLQMLGPDYAIADATEFAVEVGDVLPAEAVIVCPVESVAHPTSVIRDPETGEAVRFPLPPDYSDCVIQPQDDGEA